MPQNGVMHFLHRRIMITDERKLDKLIYLISVIETEENGLILTVIDLSRWSAKFGWNSRDRSVLTRDTHFPLTRFSFLPIMGMCEKMYKMV